VNESAKQQAMASVRFYGRGINKDSKPPVTGVTHNPQNKRKKCIGDDTKVTKAAARQSLNCIIKKIKYGEERFSICRMEFLHPAMWHDHDIDFVR